jgi:hypothetical protein
MICWGKLAQTTNDDEALQVNASHLGLVLQPSEFIMPWALFCPPRGSKEAADRNQDAHA